jgi:hypothetical protein
MTESIVTGRALPSLDERRKRLAELWSMSAAERVGAMRRGEPSLEQSAAWAARHPEQVPLIESEFEYLAAFTAEVGG